jgi:TRAP-type C4-dicarboxylate transport system substrate-binding protein
MTSLNRLAAGAAIAAAMLAAGGAKAQEHTLTFHHFLSELAPAHTGMIAPWVERVMENAGGQLAIEIYPSMSLGGRPPELIQQARDGVADIVWTVNGYTAGLFPRSEVFELPGVFLNDPAAANLAIREMFDEYLAEENQGVKVLFMHVHAGNGLHMVDAEIRSPSDLEGMTLRTPSRTGAWVIEALGADPVAMPVPELPQALARGVVEGALIPWEIAAPLRLQEQTQYQIEGHDKTRFGTTVFQVSMNQGTWDSLPEDIQQAFLDASDEDWLVEVGEIWRQADDTVITMLEDAGNTHVTLDESETEAFLEALEPVVDRWIEDVTAQGVDGAALVERAREAIAEHSRNGS